MDGNKSTLYADPRPPLSLSVESDAPSLLGSREGEGGRPSTGLACPSPVIFFIINNKKKLERFNLLVHIEIPDLPLIDLRISSLSLSASEKIAKPEEGLSLSRKLAGVWSWKHPYANRFETLRESRIFRFKK